MTTVRSPVPSAVSGFQAHAALLNLGLLDDVETAVAAYGPLAQLAWGMVYEVRRNSSLVIAISTTLGWTSDFVDDLFRAAKQIEA